jgi:hypothetical protein
VRVVEINQPHAHLRHRRGKTDAIDAEAAARKVLSGEATIVPKETPVRSRRSGSFGSRGAVPSRPAPAPYASSATSS